jgi:hypothetical protein
MFERSARDRDTNSTFLTDILELTFSGPEPISSQVLPALGITLPGKISFFTNFYGNASDDLVPEFARAPVKTSLFSNDFALRQDNGINMMGSRT